MTGCERVSPTLDDILDLMGQAPGSNAAAEADEFVRQVAEAAADVQPWVPLPAAQPAKVGAGAGGDAMDCDAGATAEMADGGEEPASYAYGDDDDVGGDYGGGESSSACYSCFSNVHSNAGSISNIPCWRLHRFTSVFNTLLSPMQALATMTLRGRKAGGPG